jgi:DNA-binding NtrC family response regulator
VSGPEGATELAGALSRLGHEVQEEDTVEAAIAAIAHGNHDLLFVDPNRLAGMDPAPTLPMIVLADGSARAPATANCLGALPRTAPAAAVETLVRLVLELQAVRNRCLELEALAAGVRDGSAFVGRSPVIRRMQSAISRAADSDATVLIEGERGSGKSLAVRMIHCKSRRGNKRIVVESASRLDPEGLTRALGEGRGTTLAIEDIDQLSVAAQQLLVRHIKERSALPPSDVPPARIIATTGAQLSELVARGAFREDLYYRLHVFPIVMPSLRERLDDLPLLVESVLDQCRTNSPQRGQTITPAAMVLLESMSWPGNVAQLEAVVRRAHYLAAGGPIDREHLAAPTEPVVASAARPTAVAEDETEVTEAMVRPFEDEEQRLLSRALRATRGNVRRAAQLLGIGRATLYRKIQQYRLRLQ